MTANVEVQTVTRRFGTVTALDHVDLAIDAGRYAVLLGPSGCGKTTLLSILGGFVSPSEGRVLIGGRDVTDLPPAKRPSTTMFQDYALFPHMSLGDNVAFGLRMRGVGRKDRRHKAEEMLALVGLDGSAARRPHELSGGQRQRVALARALAVDPDLLLLDEPLGALDLKLRRQMQDELKAIQKRVGTTFVHVTHDQEEAMAIADDIIVMNAGRIQDINSPEAIYLRPRNRFTASFMGEANFLEAKVTETNCEQIVLTTDLGALTLPATAAAEKDLAVGEAVDLCFRPEHVATVGGAEKPVDLGSARILDVAFFGTHHRCHVEPVGGAGRFSVHVPQSSDMRPGDEIRLAIDADAVIVLTKEQIAGSGDGALQA